jgi:hypothetical protein
MVSVFPVSLVYRVVNVVPEKVTRKCRNLNRGRENMRERESVCIGWK